MNVTEDLVTEDLVAETLTSEICCWLVDRLKNLECAYRSLKEADQRALINEANDAATMFVRRVVSVIAANGADALPVTVRKVVNTGSEIQATLICGRTADQRHALFDAAGFSSVLTLADPAKFEGGDLPQPDASQPGLI